MRRFSFPRWRLGAAPVALAVVSLAAAVALWVVVTEAENPTRQTVFSGSIEVRAVNLPEGLAVASVREPIVSFRISAPEDTIKKLTPADFRAEVDLSGVRQTTSDQRVVGHVVGRRDVDLIDVTPATVTVVMEPLTTRMVPVQANLIGAPPQGFSAGALDLNPAQVKISGAESLVLLVKVASADVNLTGLRVSLSQQYSLVPRDARGADVRGVKVEPATADLGVTIVQQEVKLTLAVLPSIQGSVADGYNLVAVSSDPPAIEVSGALELLQALPSVPTEAIDVSGFRTDVTRVVRLRLPAGLQAARPNVSVRLRIVPAMGEITVALPAQIVNVPEGLRAVVQDSSITLRLSGELPALQALQRQLSGNVKVTGSAAGLTEGVQVLKAEVTKPDNIQVVSIEPARIVVVLKR